MRDKWLVLIFVVGLMIYAVWTTYVVLNDKPVDYYQYLIAAYALARGENIYVESPAAYDAIAKELRIPDYQNAYQYPVLTALSIWPMVHWPIRVGAAIWVFGSGVAALIAGLLLGAHTDAAWKRRLILTAAIGFVPIFTTMHAGQVNVFVLLFVAATLYVWRKSRDALGGAWLAVSLWLKPFAVALLGLALWRMRWRTLIGLVAVSMVIMLAGLLIFGPGPSISQFQPGPGGLSRIGFAYPTNTNLNGMLSRWFMPSEESVPLVSAPQAILPFYLVLSAVFALASALVLWPMGATTRPIELEAALLMIVTHLIFPITWYHHLTMTFVAFAALIERWHDWRRPSWDMLILMAAYLMLAIHGLLWHRLVGQTLLLDLATWAEIIVFALLAVQLRKYASLVRTTPPTMHAMAPRLPG